jgi:AcrR family transcriptional regulator
LESKKVVSGMLIARHFNINRLNKTSVLKLFLNDFAPPTRIRVNYGKHGDRDWIEMKKIAQGVGRRSSRLHAATGPALVKKPETKALLIETAERFFGQHGLDGISLREIAIAAGQSNSNVVQYHFKDKAGLIRAILEHHVSDFEALRKEQLEKLTKKPSQRVRELLKILWMPAMTVVDADGGHRYCRFLQQYMIHPHNVQHPIVQFYKARKTAGEVQQNLAGVIEATRMLRDHYSALPLPVLDRRMSALSMMFLATVVEHDNLQMFGNSEISEPFDLEPVLDMAIGALDAPAN